MPTPVSAPADGGRARPAKPGRRRGAATVLAGALAGAAALGGCAPSGHEARLSAASDSAEPAPAARPTSPARPSVAVPEAARTFRSPRSAPAVAEPVRLRIARLRMDTALERLGRAPDGTVEVPRRWSRAGWYAEGARPGQSGSAVVLGHLDSPTGPAVFARLSTLRRGDRVVVARADRTSATFVVEEMRHHDRDRFPTVDVYFPTARPTLRLVTCGGRYVKSAGGYQQNVIVFARAAR